MIGNHLHRRRVANFSSPSSELPCISISTSLHSSLDWSLHPPFQEFWFRILFDLRTFRGVKKAISMVNLGLHFLIHAARLFLAYGGFEVGFYDIADVAPFGENVVGSFTRHCNQKGTCLYRLNLKISSANQLGSSPNHHMD